MSPALLALFALMPVGYDADLAPYVNVRMLVAGLDPTADDRWTDAARDRIAAIVRSQPVVDAFVESQGMLPTEDRVTAAYEAMATELTRRSPEATIEQTLKAAGTTAEALRAYLRSEMGFARFVRETVTDDQIRAAFRTHRTWYDGTEATIRQVVADSPSEVPADATPVVVRGLGAMPRDVAKAVLSADVGERLTVTSPLGRHSIVVDAIAPGGLSGEDARPAVLAELRRQLRDEIVAGTLR